MSSLNLSELQKYQRSRNNRKFEKYLDINENTSDGRELLDAIRDDAIDSLGYFLKPF